jgi:hypothetical protein
MTASNPLWINSQSEALPMMTPPSPSLHTMNGRKFVYPRRRSVTTPTGGRSSSCSGIKSIASFRYLTRSSSLPTFTTTGDKQLQSHHGKRRYQRRGSRCPSMLIQQISHTLLEEKNDATENDDAKQVALRNPASAKAADEMDVVVTSKSDRAALALLTRALELSRVSSPKTSHSKHHHLQEQQEQDL